MMSLLASQDFLLACSAVLLGMALGYPVRGLWQYRRAEEARLRAWGTSARLTRRQGRSPRAPLDGGRRRGLLCLALAMAPLAVASFVCSPLAVPTPLELLYLGGTLLLTAAVVQVPWLPLVAAGAWIFLAWVLPGPLVERNWEPLGHEYRLREAVLARSGLLLPADDEAQVLPVLVIPWPYRLFLPPLWVRTAPGSTGGTVTGGEGSTEVPSIRDPGTLIFLSLPGLPSID